MTDMSLDEAEGLFTEIAGGWGGAGELADLDRAAAVLLEEVARLRHEVERLRADAVPDTGQVGRCGNAPRYQPKNLALHSSCTLPRGHAGWHRDTGTGAEWGQAWTDPDTGHPPAEPSDAWVIEAGSPDVAIQAGRPQGRRGAHDPRGCLMPLDRPNE